MANNLIENVRLNEEFLQQYEGKQPKWGFGGLGYIVYIRTYSRKKADGNLERWDETAKRITEGNFRIEAQRLHEIGKLTQEKVDQLNEEMQRFYHLVFNLVILPPGRGLWMSGTEYAERVGDAENNCWGVSMRPQSYFNGESPRVSFAPVFTFDQAMKGGGVGINVQHKYVDQVPEVNNKLTLSIQCDTAHDNYDSELLSLGVTPFVGMAGVLDTNNYIKVDDSREGWAEALGAVIDAHYEGRSNLVLNLSDVRPRGSEIRGFGGVASGPAPLVEMLTKVNEIINRRVGDNVTPTEWGDVVQLIGTCVVSGNVRRTALILIGDQDDQDFVESKNYSLEKNQEASGWRWASNNSVSVTADSSRETLRDLAVNIYYNGEPGYTNIELSKNYGRIIDGFQKDVDGEVEVFNPCGEITLPNGSPCNLFEINLPKVDELVTKGIETEKLYEEAAYYAARYAYRITFRHYEWEVTRDVINRHRRLGVGITGITDWALMKFGEKAIVGFEEDGTPKFNEEVTSFLDELYRHVKESNVAQAEDLEANLSIKVTTVKPSGTVSILMGVSPGQHYHWAPYMIRRVRMSAQANLVDVLLKCGYYIEPAVVGINADGSNKYDTNTVVVEFPVKAPTADHPKFQSAGNVPLREQAALQALLASYWADNAVSATLSFKKAQKKPVFFEDGSKLHNKFGEPKLEVNAQDEAEIIDEITDILDRYKGVIKSTSLLPHATDTYPQMPYEEISKEEYEKKSAKITAKPWEIINGDLQADGIEDGDIVGECLSGSCPVK